MADRGMKATENSALLIPVSDGRFLGRTSIRLVPVLGGPVFGGDATPFAFGGPRRQIVLDIPGEIVKLGRRVTPKQGS